MFKTQRIRLSNPPIDREERTVAELLTRFKNLVTLACSPREMGAIKEVAAAQALQIEVESTALVSLVHDTKNATI